jgi:hypothetical protein
MVFPFYGIHKSGWIIKPRGKTAIWGACCARLTSVKKAINKLNMLQYETTGTKSKVLDLKEFLPRFSTLEQMYTSYKVGHPVWEGPVGKLMESEFGFDSKMYKSISVDASLAVMHVTRDHHATPKEISQMNKWLRSD